MNKWSHNAQATINIMPPKESDLKKYTHNLPIATNQFEISEDGLSVESEDCAITCIQDCKEYLFRYRDDYIDIVSEIKCTSQVVQVCRSS
jgi:hypothetical protein